MKFKTVMIILVILILIAAIVIVLGYALVPFKTALLWILNLLYFIFVAYISYLWIKFNYITIA